MATALEHAVALQTLFGHFHRNDLQLLISTDRPLLIRHDGDLVASR